MTSLVSRDILFFSTDADIFFNRMAYLVASPGIEVGEDCLKKVHSHWHYICKSSRMITMCFFSSFLRLSCLSYLFLSSLLNVKIYKEQSHFAVNKNQGQFMLICKNRNGQSCSNFNEVEKQNLWTRL